MMIYILKLTKCDLADCLRIGQLLGIKKSHFNWRCNFDLIVKVVVAI